ncbi:MAG: T9SS type A sorting domain-containing protein, partial [Salinivirgaceae bacterium]|nr:T9SS type A sorting domain-containing protein [Salinivirgaceae bacterium]
KHFDPNYSEGDLFQPESWLYKLGVTSMLENNGARLKQLLHLSGLAADVDSEKLPESFNGSLPNIDAFVPNMNSSVVLTYQSLESSAPLNNLDNEPIAVKYQDRNSTVIICGVPLYYFKADESKILLKKMLEDDMMVGQREQTITDNQIETYPNPVSGELYFRNASEKPIDGFVNLNDMAGRVVLHQKLDVRVGEIGQISTIGIAPGIYVLSVEGTQLRQKIIIE